MFRNRVFISVSLVALVVAGLIAIIEATGSTPPRPPAPQPEEVEPAVLRLSELPSKTEEAEEPEGSPCTEGENTHRTFVTSPRFTLGETSFRQTVMFSESDDDASDFLEELFSSKVSHCLTAASISKIGAFGGSPVGAPKVLVKSEGADSASPRSMLIILPEEAPLIGSFSVYLELVAVQKGSAVVSLSLARTGSRPVVRLRDRLFRRAVMAVERVL